MTMTKAERIFRMTKIECENYINNWGYEANVGFNKVIYRDDESVCKRTLNEITTHLERARRNIKIDLKLGIITNEQATKENNVLNMVEKTILNTIR